MRDKLLEIVNDIIGNAADAIEARREAWDYYKCQNTAIMQRQKYVSDDEGENMVVDPYRSNRKLPSGFYPLIVDQKVQYSINGNMTGQISTDTDFSDVLGNGWRRGLQAVGEDASIFGIGVWQHYIEDGNVRSKKIDPRQIIPLLDSDGGLAAVVRVYTVSEDGITASSRVEFWDENKVVSWQKDREGQYKKIKDEPHFYKRITYGDRVSERVPEGWGRPPFSILKNNSEMRPDLDRIKPFIDGYDFVNSDFWNDLEEALESYWVLKNYQGQNIQEFLRQVKMYKALKVGGDGDARREVKTIPTEAKGKFLSNIERDIYKFGMAVNPDDIEGNVTNVRIKAMYSDLDLKANKFESAIMDFVRDALFFYGFEGVDFSINFDRSVIINNVEKSELANKSIGAISEETRLSNDPRVDDVEEEMARMQEMREAQLD